MKQFGPADAGVPPSTRGQNSQSGGAAGVQSAIRHGSSPPSLDTICFHTSDEGSRYRGRSQLLTSAETSSPERRRPLKLKQTDAKFTEVAVIHDSDGRRRGGAAYRFPAAAASRPLITPNQISH